MIRHSPDGMARSWLRPLPHSVDEGSGRHSGDECMVFMTDSMERVPVIRETGMRGLSA